MAWYVMTYVLDPMDEQAVVADLFDHVFPAGYEILDPEDILHHIKSDVWDAHAFAMEEMMHEKTAYRGYLSNRHQVETFEKALAGTPLQGHLEMAEIPDVDWQAQFEESQETIILAPGVQVIPAGCEAMGHPTVEIYLTPGVGFGSGSHETTRMAADYVVRCVKPGMRVFDLGTGSGILAILAEKLGADEVYATDNDPQAVPAARQNALANGCSLTVQCGDLFNGLSGQADVIIANIITDVLVHIPSLAGAYLRPNGQLIFSGIHPERLEEISSLLKQAGMIVLEHQSEKEWAALIAAVDYEANNTL